MLGAQFEDMVLAMTDGALKFELLSADVVIPVKLSLGEADGMYHKSSGCFVLYNYARIATLLINFEKSVTKGTYVHKCI